MGLAAARAFSHLLFAASMRAVFLVRTLFAGISEVAGTVAVAAAAAVVTVAGRGFVVLIDIVDVAVAGACVAASKSAAAYFAAAHAFGLVAEV